MATFEEIRGARQRLTDQFGTDRRYTGVPMIPEDAVREVTLALTFLDSRPAVRIDDLADAVVLLDEAMEEAVYSAQHRELEILDTLHSAGWSWQQIGEHLGYAPPTAAAQAASRVKRLQRRFPSYEPHTLPAPADSDQADSK